MRFLTENDFTTTVDEFTDVLAIMDDNDQIIAYGHLPEDEIYAIAEDYLSLVASVDDLDEWFDGHETIMYRWARPVDRDTFKFLNDDDDISDEDVPTTVLKF